MERIKDIIKRGLIAAIKKWLIDKRWLRLGEIKASFHTSGVVEKMIIRYLIQEGILDSINTKYCGYRVIKLCQK